MCFNTKRKINKMPAQLENTLFIYGVKNGFFNKNEYLWNIIVEKREYASLISKKFLCMFELPSNQPEIVNKESDRQSFKNVPYINKKKLKPSFAYQKLYKTYCDLKL